MSEDDPVEPATGDDGPSADPFVGELSRRSYLKSGGALAGSAVMFDSGAVPNGGDGHQTEVPDEPDENGQVRKFTVHAIEVDIPYNQFGLHQPVGAMYVLEENLEAARKASGRLPNDAFEAVDGDERHVDFYSGSGKTRCADPHDITLHELDHLVEEDPDQGFADEHDDEEHENPYRTDGGDHHHDDGGHHHDDGCGEDDGEHEHENGEHEHDDEEHEDGKDEHDGKGDGVDTSVLKPLVIRANEGDIVEIEFVNHLDRHASMHQVGLPYDVEESDGAKVGFNPDTTAAPGETITYRWYASHQGGHFFYDLANPAMDSADQPPQEANLLSRSLFGTMMVEPEGATWTDPFTGGELRSGVQADVHDPEFMETSYREVVVHYHTPEGIQPDVTFPDSDTPQTTHAINYRADPTGQRVAEEFADDIDVDQDLLNEFFYNSWLGGDPGGGDNMYPVYKGDPMKFVAVGASTEENHVHHLHAHRWKTIPNVTDSDTIDSQTVGLGASYPVYFVAGHGTAQGSNESGPIETVRPEMTFQEAFEVGAGGAHGTAGDNIFHCHLFPHYGEGMWGGFRIFDKEVCGLQPLPNTTIADEKVPDELPFKEGILPEDSPVPGFPDFIPNEIGSPPPDSPLATGPNPRRTGRQPTKKERKALGEIVPGAPYVDPCDPYIDNTEFGGPPAGKDAPVREYTIVALPADVVYNDNGDHDPEGLVYALEEDAEDIRCGDMNPEPLFIRANVGDCIELTVKNETERPVSIHPHFVSFDLQGSDSLAMGYNYDQDTEPGQQRSYRWYADEEGPIFFHDHIFGIDDVMHGEFCALIVEPEGSEYLDPYSGEPIRSGSQAIIQTPEDKNDFREFCLHYHDFAQLKNLDGEFITNEEEHNENAGTMGINLRNAPIYQRGDPDPAYAYSSAVHGDPPTPTLEAYSNDPIRIRLLQGAWEEQHNFHMHGRHFESEGLAEEDAVSQIIGTSEQFTFFIDPGEPDTPEYEHMDNPYGLPVRDYLYGSSVIDDRWTGMWGVHRVFGSETPHLEPLPDRGPPADDDPISKRDLKRMGHFAPFLGFDRLERFGHDALLLYDENDERTFPPDKDARQNENVGEIPPEAPGPGDPCPDDAPVKTFNVTAFRTEIVFNEYEDHDPFGIAYALDHHVEEIREGERPTDPLIIRANQGDCIEVNLTNALPRDVTDDALGDELRTVLDRLRGLDVDVADHLDDVGDALDHGPSGAVEEELRELESDLQTVSCGADDREELQWVRSRVVELLQQLRNGEIDPDREGPEHAHPKMRIEQQWEESDRISMHPMHITYDVNGSDGATVGFNYDQTVEPGETTKYRWFAADRVEFVAFWDEADVRSHRHHGAFGGIAVEPEEANWLDPRTAEPMPVGDGTMIRDPDNGDTREFALSLSDSRYIVNAKNPDNCVVPPGPDTENPDAPCNQIGADEDQGYPAINNRSEPFVRRFQTGPDEQYLVFDSESHGDPATPIPKALLGDPVRFLVGKAADKARGLSFHLAEHQWRRFSGVEESPIIGVDDRFTIGKSAHLDLISGAGGLAESTGDFLYGELKERRRLEGGFWGIFRVRKDPTDFRTPLQPLPETAVEKGVMPEDRPGWNVSRADLTGSGASDLVVGVPDSDLGGTNAGAIYVLLDAADGVVPDLADADAVFVGDAGDRLGGEMGTVASSGSEPESGFAVAATGSGDAMAIPTGKQLAELLSDPPQTQLGSMLANTTNSSIRVATSVQEVSTD